MKVKIHIIKISNCTLHCKVFHWILYPVFDCFLVDFRNKVAGV